MALKFYTDVHVPAAITEGLRRRQIDVITSQEDGTREDSDQNLLERAAKLGRALFSQDQDLLQIAHQRQDDKRFFAGLIFLSQQVSIGRLVSDLELIAQCCTEEELNNCVYYLPLQ